MFSSGVSAIGISPSRIEIDFVPNLEYPVEFAIYNSVNYSYPALVTVTGELAEFTDFEEQYVVLEPNGMAQFSYTLSLPREMEHPGNFSLQMSALQASMDDRASGVLGARVGVRSNLIVIVPFDGPYMDAELSIPNSEVGSQVPITISMRNLGTTDLPTINGEITFFGFDGEEIDSMSFDDSLELKQDKSITLYWDSSEMSGGVYTAELVGNYGDQSFESGTEFRLGSFFVDILEYQDEVKVGEINDYYTTLMSTWNSPIQDAFVELDVTYGRDVITSKSESFDLFGWQNDTVKMYFDATGIEKGKYPAKLTVFYGNGSNSVDFDLNVKSFFLSTQMIIYGSVIAGFVIVIAVLIIFMMRRRKIKRGKKK